MNATIFGLAAIALYLTAAVQTSHLARISSADSAAQLRNGLLALAALLAHGAALYPMLVTAGGFNFGIFSAASLVAWLVAGFAVLATARRSAASLTVVILPFAAVILAVSLLFSHRRVVDPQAPGLALHIALSLVAYSLFAIAALQAAYLAFAEHRLKQHTPVLGFLPPLPAMEQLLFQLTSVAFALLSVGLVVGGLYIEDVSGQHLAHKIFFSLLAWVIFAILLIGRHHWRWRGRRAVKYVIAGFVMLALGFFGSKLVLELILHRA